jgi:hypothetical protein
VSFSSSTSFVRCWASYASSCILEGVAPRKEVSPSLGPWECQYKHFYLSLGRSFLSGLTIHKPSFLVRLNLFCNNLYDMQDNICIYMIFLNKFIYFSYC